MFVKEVLHAKGAKVFTAHPDDLVEAVISELRARAIGAAVVVDRRGAIQGIISERDIVYGIARYGTEALRMPAGALMTTPAPVCSPDDDLRTIMSLMTYRRVRHVAVFSDGRLAGVISIGDVVKNRLDEIELEVNVLRDYARLTAAPH